MTETQKYEYEEVFVTGKICPIAVLQNLLQSGVISDYILYQDRDEVRIAGNMLFKVSVSFEAVSLEDTERKLSVPISDPFKQVESLLASLPIVGWTAYGYIAFDIVRFYSSYSKAIQQALLCFIVPEIEIQITTQKVKIKSIRGLDKIKELLSVNSQLIEVVSTPISIGLTDNERESYQSKVDVLIQAIQAGKLRKAILSRSVKIKGDLDVLKTYIAGTKVNNSARSYCLNIGNVRVVGFSPEILMQIDNQGFVITNPLAGTRRRGKDLEEDARLYGELFTNAKEVKEHALSVELAQQEIAQISVPETVKIFDFMQVKKYRYVQHLSSRVSGQLKSEKTLWDALKVLFPGITVSGIDKSQALEWIARLEDEPRGIYAGAIGWINNTGLVDLAIAIRSVYQYDDWIYLNAGAGIVAESIPQFEYMESVNKMNTMLCCLVLKH
ncbi:salicylate synthase [Scytonema sp. NUACC21]